MARKPRPVSVDKLLEKFFKDLGQEQKYRELKVFDVWDRVMGEEIKSNAVPVSINQGRLTVAVRNSVWLTELGFTRQKIKNRLNRDLGRGTVKDISFRIGQVPEAVEEKKIQELGPKSPVPALAKEIDRMLGSVQDKKLRQLLKDWLEAMATQ
jgi:hypothetical protein